LKKLVFAFAATALVLAACGGPSNATAATVDGTSITVGEVESLISSEESAIAKEQFAQFLSFQIQWDIVAQAATEEWGIEVTEGEIDAEADRIFESAASEGEAREDFLSSRGVTEEFLRNIAHQALLDQAVRAELADDVEPPTPEEIDAEMAVAEASLTEVCVSHILVETEEEAQDIMDRLEAGEDFGELAQELSLDTGTAEDNGVLPCGSAGQYAPAFRDASVIAPVGELYSEIVETQFGFHVMLVTDRVDPPIEDLPTEAELTETLEADAVALELNAWFIEQMTAAEVTVEEEYGTWQATPQPTVVPPTS
jgi:foldase protein PrsA